MPAKKFGHLSYALHASKNLMQPLLLLIRQDLAEIRPPADAALRGAFYPETHRRPLSDASLPGDSLAFLPSGWWSLAASGGSPAWEVFLSNATVCKCHPINCVCSCLVRSSFSLISPTSHKPLPRPITNSVVDKWQSATNYDYDKTIKRKIVKYI